MKGQARSSHGRRMLPREYFVSDQQFEQDLELMRRWWTCLGRSDQARAEGDFWLADYLGESLLMIRQPDGTLKSMHNVCRHRGTRLCVEMSGNFKQTVRCPYHGWCYDLAGNLVAAPNMHNTEGFVADDYPLVAVNVAEWEGFAFVSTNPIRTFEEIVAPLTPLIRNWQIGQLVSSNRLEYEVQANWKLILQNFSECYHCPAVHPQLNRLTPYLSAGNDLLSGPVLGGPMQLNEGIETMTMDGRFAATPLAGLTNEQRRQVCYFSLFPGMLLSPHPDYVMVHQVKPLSKDRSHVTCEFLIQADLPNGSSSYEAKSESAAQRAAEFWDVTNRQDWEMCERSQLGIQSRSYSPGPYSHLESLLPAFDQFYLQALAEMSN
jgi:glycine betaine catabolism A